MTSDAQPGAGRLAVSALLLAATVSACGSDTGDSEPTAADPTSTSSTSASTSAAPSETATPSATPSDAGDPVPSPVINKAVKAALKDGFPALVPAGVPAGWTVVEASYDKSGWRIEMTDADGAEVGLVQARGDLDRLVKRVLGKAAAKSGSVDLGEYGTGRWAVYSGGTQVGLGKVIAHTAAVIHAADQATAVELGEQLLTAEDADLPEAG